MLSDKPWRPELVMRLLAGLFASAFLGVLIVQGYVSLSGDKANLNRDAEFFFFCVGTLTMHGVALVLINVFLRQHRTTWAEGFGFNHSRLGRTLLLALLVTLLAVPIAWSLGGLSTQLLKALHQSTE